MGLLHSLRWNGRRRSSRLCNTLFQGLLRHLSLGSLGGSEGSDVLDCPDASDQLREFYHPQNTCTAEFLKLWAKMPYQSLDILYKAVQRENVSAMRTLLEQNVQV